MISTVMHIFTFQDHLFMISRCTSDARMEVVLEDELGTSRVLDSATDLKEIREKCGKILQGYRDELMLPERKSS